MAARAAGDPAPDDDENEDDLLEEAARKEAGCYLNRGPGDANAIRWRITVIVRQAIEGFFDPACVPVGDPLTSRFFIDIFCFNSWFISCKEIVC